MRCLVKHLVVKDDAIEVMKGPVEAASKLIFGQLYMQGVNKQALAALKSRSKIA